MKHFVMLVILISTFNVSGNNSKKDENGNVNISVDRSVVKYQMAGGIGASWHAISVDSIDEGNEYKWALRYSNSRGSAWGGNPPVSETKSWEQIYFHAKWLGLDWIRVELSARMYHPERTRFDWDNQEMKALYKILDWCQQNNADVFLQQMWSNVKWNAYPDVQPLLSAPKSLPDFANGISSLLSHLINEKHYTCIKWVCITNEPPGGSWGSWWSTGSEDAPLMPALKAVREALDEKGIKTPISGPDWTELPVFDANKIDFDPYIGAYDIHSYHGIDNDKQKILSDWANWAKSKNKPLFLSEIGDMNLGWKDSNPGPKTFEAALSNMESILRGMEVGVQAFNRWSFTNRGDLDGQWQLIRTWDIEKKEYLKDVKPEKAAYYGYGIITRFCAKNSKVIKTTTEGEPGVLSQSLESPSGKLTTYILNKTDRMINVLLRYQEASQSKIYLYQVASGEVESDDFKLNPRMKYTVLGNKEMKIQLAPQSISVLSEYLLNDKDLGIIN